MCFPHISSHSFIVCSYNSIYAFYALSRSSILLRCLRSPHLSSVPLTNPGRPSQLCASNPQAFLIAFQGIRHFGGRCASAGADADAKLDRENDPYVKCHGMLTIMPQLIRSIKYLSPNLCPSGFVHMYVRQQTDAFASTYFWFVVHTDHRTISVN